LIDDAHTVEPVAEATPVEPVLPPPPASNRSRSKSGKGPQGQTAGGGRGRESRSIGVTLPAQNPTRPNGDLMSSATVRLLQDSFLVSYAIRGSIKGAASDLGLSMKEVTGWRDRDAEFAQRLAIAHEEYVSHLEDILDQKINASDKNAAILLMFKLKKENNQYRDKVDVKHSGGIGLAVAEMSTEDLLKIAGQGRVIDGNSA
jgi:hypothetical protein